MPSPWIVYHATGFLPGEVGGEEVDAVANNGWRSAFGRSAERKQQEARNAVHDDTVHATDRAVLLQLVCNKVPAWEKACRSDNAVARAPPDVRLSACRSSC